MPEIGVEQKLPFKLKEEYSREREIHSVLGGNSKHGSIQRSTKFPVIMLFSGEYGRQDWYRDGFLPGEGCYKFCGSGQPENMTLGKHNSILSHIDDNIKLLLFRSDGPGEKYKYLGEFYCWKYDYEPSNVDPVAWPNILVFYLAPFGDRNATADMGELISRTKALRGKKWLVPPPGQETPAKVEFATGSTYKRDPETRAYVLDRADGHCELCKEPAPFEDADGVPFLEAHHVIPLSCSGVDKWYNMVGVCPNCHRELHYGRGREIKSESLERMLLQMRREIRQSV